ncbi:MAG TPA: diguanylate cyclase [Clostridiaceae bacterium]
MKDDIVNDINTNIQNRYNEITEKYYSLMNNTTEGIFFMKYEPEIILESNKAFEELFQIKKEEIIGKRLNLFNEGIPKKLLEIVKRCKSEKSFTVLLSDSKESIIKVSVFYKKEDRLGAVCIKLSDDLSHMDYNKLKNYLKYINMNDRNTAGQTGAIPLGTEETNIRTKGVEYEKLGFPEKDFFYWQLKKEIARYKRSKKKFAVSIIFIDKLMEIYTSIDKKLLNVLQKEISSRLLLSIRGEDTIANYNDGEFGMIQTMVNSRKDIGIVTSKIFNNLEKPIVYNGLIFLNIRIGVSIFPDDGRDIQTLLSNAEVAKLKAIATGEKLQFFATSSMGDDLDSLMEQNKILRQIKKH